MTPEELDKFFAERKEPALTREELVKIIRSEFPQTTQEEAKRNVAHVS